MNNFETASSPELKKIIETAWLFDVDGVITHPEQKKVTEDQILDEIIEKLQLAEPVALNTGRSLSWLTKEVIEPLRERLKEKKIDLKILENFLAVGEKGSAWLTFAEGGQEQEALEQAVSVPQFLQQEVRELIQSQFSKMMFYDESKKTMISIEMKKGISVSEFRVQQQRLNQELLKILQKHKLEGQFKIDPTTIATDIESKDVGKGLGARKILEWLKRRRIEPKQFIAFGDSRSDLEMAEEIQQKGQAVEFVFVGEEGELAGINHLFSVTFTKDHHEKGVIEYLNSRPRKKRK